MRFIQSLKLAGLLSFPPDMEPFELESLNVLIGPNGSGKSNFIEAFELLRAAPTDLAAVFAKGGGVREWIWKGAALGLRAPCLDLTMHQVERQASAWSADAVSLRYRLRFGEVGDRFHIFEESIAPPAAAGGDGEPPFYLFHSHDKSGSPDIDVRDGLSGDDRRRLLRDIASDRPILAQLRDPFHHPEITWMGRTFSQIQTLREWSFGRNAEARRPQPAHLPEDRLLPDMGNLAAIVNQVENWGKWQEFNDLMKRFFPRFERLSPWLFGGTVQLRFHETGFDTPIPAARMSDGTLRFIIMLAVLLSPEPPPLLCIDEPELGLHPDAVALMAEVLAEASERMQLVVATHSDALVSALSDRPSAIIACERPGDGTILRRLDPERLSDLLEDYTLGHLWRQGELGANP